MKTATLIQAGDFVTIDDKYPGQVVASMDTSTYLAGYESCACFAEGIMVVTDFSGLVQYTNEATDRLAIETRNSQKS